MSMMQEKMYMDVDDVWAILGVSKAYAYNLMREYNKELKANDQMYMYRQSRKCTDYYRLCPFHSFFPFLLS